MIEQRGVENAVREKTPRSFLHETTSHVTIGEVTRVSTGLSGDGYGELEFR